ncbi:CaiB/BaiF CoA transferase family protein [Faunimonas sp. B44]|uniref:CaiB/BaiF CoA transferase family protein n=1 Tax=Faunimonas sp. B44 TaxID=3461493 RepID=UPI004044486A
MAAGILDGVVVAEVGTRAACSYCGSLLAQLGATVVYVELGVPPGQPAQGKSLWREQFAAGKLSVSPKSCGSDRQLLDTLVARSDIVLISSDADPSLLRMSLPEEPGNVVCDVTAFGASGPLRGVPASDAQVQALSGLMDTTGFPDGPPMLISIPIADVLAGTYAAAAVLSARRAQRLQGISQRIEIALFDCAFLALGTFLSGTLIPNGEGKSRLGNRHPTVAPWNLYPARDGWVLICAGSQPQWEQLCSVIRRPDLAARFPNQGLRVAHAEEIDQGIGRWTEARTTAACIEMLTEAGVACGPIAPIDGYPREENLEHRKMIQRIRDPVSGRDVFVPASPLRMSVSACTAPSRIPAPDEDRADLEQLLARTPERMAAPVAARPLARALTGLRVIEIGQYTTAPLCARQLAHLGAEVIKVEQPGGDQSRTWVPHIDGRSVSFRLNNADKKSLVLDLRTEFGRSALRQLIASADVLVENLKPGALAKFGLSPANILKINPRLVYCAISGFGADSLYPKRPAFDSVIQAMSGFMAALDAGEIPLKSGISTADTMGAEMAMVAVLGALECRDRTGTGQFIDLSMQDVSAWLSSTSWNGAGARDTPREVLGCADGHLLVSRTGTAAGTPEAIPPAVADELATLSRERAASRLAAAGFDATPVLTVAEAARLPQTEARRLWFLKEEDGIGWPMLASPLRLSVTPPIVSSLAPAAGKDGAAILRELGLADPGRTDGPGRSAGSGGSAPHPSPHAPESVPAGMTDA